MRVVVGSGPSTDLKRPSSIGILNSRPSSSPASSVARSRVLHPRVALCRLDRLAGANRHEPGLRARRHRRQGGGDRLEPEEDLRQLFATLSELSPREPAKALIRWARDPRLLDAHEQATYGGSVCWSGDAMRREADKRNGLSLFESAAPEAVRLAQLAFAALWGASTVVTERRLAGQRRCGRPAPMRSTAESRRRGLGPARPPGLAASPPLGFIAPKTMALWFVPPLLAAALLTLRR